MTPPVPNGYPISTKYNPRNIDLSISAGVDGDDGRDVEGRYGKKTNLEDCSVGEVSCAIKIGIGMGCSSDYSNNNIVYEDYCTYYVGYVLRSL